MSGSHVEPSAGRGRVAAATSQSRVRPAGRRPRAEPPGALDGRPLGSAAELLACALPLGPGRHTVQVLAPGFRPYAAQFVADPSFSSRQDGERPWPEDVLEWGTRNGAAALGLGTDVGSLEVGKKADLIVLDARRPHLVPALRIVSGWIHNGQAGDVESVMVDGRWLMRDHKVLTIDEADVVTRAEEIGRRVWRQLVERYPNVPFPIKLPPLRERTGDIPRLVRHFAEKHASRMNKHIDTIPAETMRALSRWHWPGNVRELENFIERAVILSRGNVLNVPVSELQASAPLAMAMAAAALRPLRPPKPPKSC